MKKFVPIVLAAAMFTMPVAFAAEKAGVVVPSPVVVSAPAASAATEMTVTAHALNVRSEGKLGKNIVGHLKKGSKVTVEKIVGSWAQISFKGKTAFVSTKYLK